MRILFFAPHPDDVELFAPGTAMKHSDEGNEVIEVIMSYGEKGAIDESLKGEPLARIRKMEGERGAKVMGIKEVRYMGYEDITISSTKDTSRWWTLGGSVEIRKEDVNRIRDTIGEISPDLIYAPSCRRSIYRHKDHLATGMLVLAARGQIDDLRSVRLYHALFPNILINVSECFDRICKARNVHKSQEFMIGPLEPILRLYSRFLGIRRGCRYAEGFIEIRNPSLFSPRFDFR